VFLVSIFIVFIFYETRLWLSQQMINTLKL